MGIGVQSEACGEVAQHTGHRLDVYSVLEGDGCESVAEVMKSNFRDTSPFEDSFQHIVDTVRGDRAAVGGGEDVGIFQLFRLCFFCFRTSIAC